jgi:hypothetical protein
MPVSRVTFTAGLTATPYTAGDVVGGAIQIKEFTAGSEIIVTSAWLMAHIAANPSSAMTSFRLHLYRKTPPSALADNAVFDIPSGDREAYIGYVDIGTIADLGSTLFVQATQLNEPYLLNGTGLFGYLVTAAAYTPAGNAETYTLAVKAISAS